LELVAPFRDNVNFAPNLSDRTNLLRQLVTDPQNPQPVGSDARANIEIDIDGTALRVKKELKLSHILTIDKTVAISVASCGLIFHFPINPNFWLSITVSVPVRVRRSRSKTEDGAPFVCVWLPIVIGVKKHQR